MELPTIENVVRVIFPLTMIREGELLPAAFKLREQDSGPESYLSVFRQFSECFISDINSFDRGCNLPCCIMNVGEINKINLTVDGNAVLYITKAVPTSLYKSHAGIFITIGGLDLKGCGEVIFDALNIGEEASFHLLAIRRRLVDIAKKRITVVNELCKKSEE